MTAIIFDGTNLVIDRAASVGPVKYEINKSIIFDNEVVTGTGVASEVSALRSWYADGADPDKYPAFQAVGDRKSELIIGTYGGIRRYERTPDPIYHGKFKCAFGAGHQIAYGALMSGAGAIQAMRIVAKHHAECGCGMDIYNWHNGVLVHAEYLAE